MHARTSTLKDAASETHRLLLAQGSRIILRDTSFINDTDGITIILNHFIFHYCSYYSLHDNNAILLRHESQGE